jgi:outer membrane protein assembly factor BamD (BamD/ComL family)
MIVNSLFKMGNGCKKLVVFVPALLVAVSCSNKKEDVQASLKASIDSSEKVLYATAATSAVDAKIGEKAVAAYIRYVEKFPADSNSADYLFNAAEVASAIKMTQSSLLYFEKFEKQYPTNSKAPMALFLQGFIYENDLSDFGKATIKYQEVIKKYPNSKIAVDAQACINNLGKSPEELINEFEEKNKKKNQ